MSCYAVSYCVFGFFLCNRDVLFAYLCNLTILWIDVKNWETKIKGSRVGVEFLVK